MISLGIGTLTWNVNERRSDRYGTVYLIEDGIDSMSDVKAKSLIRRTPQTDAIQGAAGRLIAVVQTARKSTHIGDLFRGVFPRIPRIGQTIVLGTGKLFFAAAPEGGSQVGLLPEDGRDSDWLDIRALYDCHEQTVELFFEPEVG